MKKYNYVEGTNNQAQVTTEEQTYILLISGKRLK